MTDKQRKIIKELKQEIRELNKKVTRLRVIDNEVFKKDEKIISLKKKLNKSLNNLRSRIC